MNRTEDWSTVDEALRYLSLGWSIFPVEPPVLGDKESGKNPLVPTWQKYQKHPPTREQVQAWWEAWPNAGIAIVTGRVSGLVVVDVDPQHGGTPEGLPKTQLVVRTGGGGWHYYYQYPEGIEHRIPNQVNVDGTGKDVRADGGYVIAPPSGHFMGKDYRWETDRFSSGLAPQWSEAPPSWAIAPEPKPEEVAGGKEKWLTELLTSGAPTGQRNSSLVRMAGYYAAKGLPEDACLALCHRWNGSLPEPLGATEVEVTVKSAYKMERRKEKSGGDEKPFEGLKLLSLDEYMLKHGSGETEWTVQDWLPRATVAFVISPPQSFKTWTVFDLACSVASGQPFLGQYTVNGPGPVLLFQQEDAHMSIAQRVSLIGGERLNRVWPTLEDEVLTIPTITMGDLPLHFHEERQLRFDHDEAMDSLEEHIARIRPKLVILDPLYSAVDSEEYMAKAAKKMMRLKDLRDAYDCSFVIVHHTRKSMDSWDRQQLWGSQFINAFIETSWLFRKPDNTEPTDAVVLRHTKADGPLPLVHLDFNIDTKNAPWRYEVKTKNVSEDEADAILKRKGGEEERPNADEERLVRLLEDSPTTLQTSRIAEHLDMSEKQVTRLLRGLLHKHRVKQDAAQCWTLLDPAYK